MPIIAKDGPLAEPEYDLRLLQEHAQRLRDCLDLDLLEEQTAQAVMQVHAELNQDHDLFRAVWSQLGSKERRALNKYIALACDLERYQPPTGKLS